MNVFVTFRNSVIGTFLAPEKATPEKAYRSITIFFPSNSIFFIVDLEES